MEIKTAGEATFHAAFYVDNLGINAKIRLGTPVLDEDRFWKVPVFYKDVKLGEVVFDAVTGYLSSKKTTKKKDILENYGKEFNHK